MDYTITLTETERLAMEYITSDVDEWITNSAKCRARLAIDEIIALNTKYCNENNIQLALGESNQVLQAYELGVLSQQTSDNFGE